MSTRIKNRQDEKGALFFAHSSGKTTPNQLRPKFSLEYIQSSYGLRECTKEEKAAFIDCLHEMSQLTWQQLHQAERHKQGYEIINRDAINTGIPSYITEDTQILAFRFSDKKPMVGFRRDEVFFVVWLDRDFTLYKH
jgi:hypothetical protein